jgi:hypothetical protein
MEVFKRKTQKTRKYQSRKMKREAWKKEEGV